MSRKDDDTKTFKEPVEKLAIFDDEYYLTALPFMGGLADGDNDIDKAHIAAYDYKNPLRVWDVIYNSTQDDDTSVVELILIPLLISKLESAFKIEICCHEITDGIKFDPKTSEFEGELLIMYRNKY